MQTKYGRAILVWLYDPNTKERFKVFLPPAVCKTIPDDNPDDNHDSNDDDESYHRDTSPSSVGRLLHFKMAYCGKVILKKGYTKYDVRFCPYDQE